MSLARTMVSGVVLSLLLAACEDSVEPGNQLTREESVALVKGAAVTLGQVLGDSTLIVSVLPDTIVARCPLGGLAKLHGVVIEEQGDTIRKVLDLRFLPDQCAIAADGTQLTIDAAPVLVYQLRINIIPATSEFTISGQIRAKLVWTLDDRSGHCEVNMTLVAVPNPVTQTLTGVYRGSLCKHRVEIGAGALLVVDL